ncbi:patatin-like phospholipase family protein [Phenylobacterium sp.]|uniref:patatin-like phospholipase family protein n=1 Tax=Phenylobacterium sp. TaxID=1871053 RepID=UPI002F3E72B9
MRDTAETGSQPRRVLVLQGGGALGAYQGGVYEALSDGGVQPHWVAGISIGAINAAIIAGNPPESRVARLREFWELVSSGLTLTPVAVNEQMRAMISEASAGWAATFGVPGMFAPRLVSPLLRADGGPEALSFYDTTPLRQTLERLVDFDRINSGETRLSVGAVNIRTGNFAYFDNVRETIGPEHIMASGALPPGLPPVEIKGQWYWDGGLVSNTPLEYVLEADRQDDLLIHQVDLFNARGRLPRSLPEAIEREKEIRFSSRTRHNTDTNMRIHELKSALRNLIGALPASLSDDPDVQMLGAFSKETAVTVVQLIYRSKVYEGGSKDYEFSRPAMQDHWTSGVVDAKRSLRRQARYMAASRPGGTAVFDPGRDEAAKPPSALSPPASA